MSIPTQDPVFAWLPAAAEKREAVVPQGGPGEVRPVLETTVTLSSHACHLDRIDDGVACVAGGVGDAWYCAVLTQHDRDLDFREPRNSVWSGQPDALKAGATLDAWAEAVGRAAPREIVLVRPSKAGLAREILAQGPGLEEPAVVRQDAGGPLVAWIRNGQEGSETVLWDGGASRPVWQSPWRCRSLEVARRDGTVLLACQMAAPAGPTVRVWRADGPALFEVPGRNPRLAVAAGTFYALYEAPEPDGCRLVLVALDGLSEVARFDLPAGNDLNLHASLTADPASGTLYVAHEAAPLWGVDEQLGRHRDICLWQLGVGETRLKAAPHTANGLLPIPPRAFCETVDKQATPLTPLVRVVGGRLSVFVRRFRQHGIKSFGWDVYRVDHAADGWRPPARISENYGTPDRAYDVLDTAGGVLLFQPCCEQLPGTRVNVDAPAGYMWTEHHELLSGHPGRPYDLRAEIRSCPSSVSLPELTVLKGMAGRYGIPPAVRHPAPEPPPLAAPNRPKLLVWGDLHVHSAYSKCIAPMDGTPEEKLRFQRDHLGCRVLCLSEHTHLMSDAEVEHACDMLEAEAGDTCVPLYASEPLVTGEDTLYYARDRAVFRRLRAILQRCHERPEQYREIKRLLPPQAVLAARHFDGPGGTHRDFGVDSFDPDLEAAMEAMQVRGDSLMGQLVCGDGHTKSTNTAAKFLNAGKRVGLLGGTDHCGGYGQNHFCLTGFWVDEATPAAIWAALWQRRTIAVSKGKLAIWASCGDTAMGDAGAATGPVRIRAWVACARQLRRICLLRDGVPLPWRDLDGTTAEVELTDENAPPGAHWYAVTAEARSPFHGQSVLAHSSPIFALDNVENQT